LLCRKYGKDFLLERLGELRVAVGLEAGMRTLLANIFASGLLMAKSFEAFGTI